MSADPIDNRRRLPSMTELLKRAVGRAELSRVSRRVLTDALRDALEAARAEARGSLNESDDAEMVESILNDAARHIGARRSHQLNRVINATGIVLHTGLGRSVLCDAAVQRINEATGYCNLEIDLDSGERGRRGSYAEELLCKLTGAQSALIVNNNAAATMLVLHGLASGGEVIVSRGQLIEIGGSFRLPEVMSAGGAILREVGTTNKTHLSDYENAIVDRTAFIMHVHTSNYRVVGFSENPIPAQLAELAHARGLKFFDDLGSGALLEDELWSRANEPTAVASLRAGSDVTAFSGDKLLGGPQAGILLGKAETIETLRKSPMARALRVDKLTLAALEATLELYLDYDAAKCEIPTLARLAESIDHLDARAQQLLTQLKMAIPAQLFSIERNESFAGGGSLPAWPLPTVVVRWLPPSNLPADAWARRLRQASQPVLARVQDQHVLFDVRTIDHNEHSAIVAAMTTAISAGA